MTAQTIESEDSKSDVSNHRHWQRLVFMLLFAVLLQLASAVMWVLCALQFLFSLVKGQDNPNLRCLGNTIAQYIYQTLQYLSYNTSQKPFPFADWPEPLVEETSETVVTLDDAGPESEVPQ